MDCTMHFAETTRLEASLFTMNSLYIFSALTHCSICEVQQIVIISLFTND